jgi:hypothetical protein
MIRLAVTEDRRDGRVAEPHRRLMMAVLQTVWDDCRGTAYRRKTGPGSAPTLQAARHAIAYATSTDRRWPFSFENICEALGLDADRLRRELDKETGGLMR